MKVRMYGILFFATATLGLFELQRPLQAGELLTPAARWEVVGQLSRSVIGMFRRMDALRAEIKDLRTQLKGLEAELARVKRHARIPDKGEPRVLDGEQTSRQIQKSFGSRP